VTRTALSPGRLDQVVDAASRCITAKGISGLRMRDVADEVGLNIATVHYYVPSKAELIRLVVTRAHEQFATRATPSAWISPREAVRAHLTAAFAVVEDDPALARVLAEVAVEAAHDPAIAEIVEAAEERWRRALHRILAGVPTGRRRQASALIMLTLQGACLRPTDARAVRAARQALVASIDALLEESP